MSKPSDLRYGALNPRATVHICVDVQRMFAEQTDWHAPWLRPTLPNILALVAAHPDHTIMTRFIPAQRQGQGIGMWRHYYQRWQRMTLTELGEDMVDLVEELKGFVPPAKIFDKAVYSPWHGSQLNDYLRTDGIDTVVISGGETDVCVLATLLGAVDWGYRTVLAVDAIFGSADQTHDAMMEIYRNRFGEQVEVAATELILRNWN